MTKEKLIDNIYSVVNRPYGPKPTVTDVVDEFFNSNVVISKGTTRHPHADVLHEWIEGAEIECNENNSGWYTLCHFPFTSEYRIKPSEPLYEYKVRMNFKDGSCEYTSRYFTKQEFDDFGFPSSCELAEETKQERKQ